MDVICSISNKNLNREECYVLLLEKNPYQYKDKNLKNTEPYFPFGFPIKGACHDFGNISDIDINKNVQQLEDFFNLDIERILDYVGGEVPEVTKMVDNPHIFNGLSKTYIHKEIYEHILQLQSVEITDRRFERLSESLQKYTKARDKAKDFMSFQMNTKNILLLSNIRDLTYNNWVLKFNMFEKLSFGCDFSDELKNQYIFLRTISDLDIVLRPSVFGGTHNSKLKAKLFEKVLSIHKNDNC